jgi:hypothetical protein
MNQAQLVQTIKVHIAKGDKAADKAEQHYIAAGQHLKTLKAQHKGNWAEWEELLKAKIGIGKSRASELMLIADGTKTVAEIRAEKAESMRQLRASPPRGGEGGFRSPRISISQAANGKIEVKVATEEAPCGCSAGVCDHCGGEMFYQSTYVCANAKSALAVIQACTDPETYEALQTVKRLYQEDQNAWRDLAQWLLDHPQYPAAVVADWLKWDDEDDEAGIIELRRWAKNGFEGPFPR